MVSDELKIKALSKQEINELIKENKANINEKSSDDFDQLLLGNSLNEKKCGVELLEKEKIISPIQEY